MVDWGLGLEAGDGDDEVLRRNGSQLMEAGAAICSMSAVNSTGMKQVTVLYS